MVNVDHRVCPHVFSIQCPHYNFARNKKPNVCQQHAEDGIFDVISRRYLHDSCMKNHNYNVESSKKAAYCKGHADKRTVNVCTWPPFKDFSTKGRGRVFQASVMATACPRSKRDGLDVAVVNCRKQSTSELVERKPRHNRDDGPTWRGGRCLNCRD